MAKETTASLQYQIKELQQMIRLVVDVGELLIQSRSLGELLRESCERITEHRMYRVAWIGLLDRDTQRLEVGFQSDRCPEPYLDTAFRVSADRNDALGRGPAGRCINENRTVIVANTQLDPDFAPWRDKAIHSKIQSVIGLPLREAVTSEPFGCLIIYTVDPRGFGFDEVNALQELANVIGRAIQVQRETSRRLEAQQAVAASEQRLQHVLAGADLGYWDWYYQTGCHEVSDRWLEILGLDRSDIANHVSDWAVRIHSEDKGQVEVIVMRSIEEKCPYRAEFRMRHKDGHWVWIEGSGSVTEWDERGNPVRLCGTHQEITHRKKTEALLLANEKRFRELIQTLPNVAIQGWCRDGRVVYWNSASERLYGFKAGEVLGQPLRDLTVPEPLRASFSAAFDEWVKRGIPMPSGEQMLQRKDKRPVPVYSSYVALKENTERPEFFRVDVDLTEQKAAQSELERLATYDPLTQLPNRNLFYAQLHRCLSEAARSRGRLALLFIDLDNFKVVNDSFGHDYGDRLLQQVATRMTEGLREGDILARFGGDEFVLVMTRFAGNEEVAAVAERILGLLVDPFRLQGQEVFVGASIGVSLFPDDGGDADTLLKQADAAMYRAKESRRGHVQFFTPMMHSAIERHLAIASGLRQALGHDGLQLVYQPQLDLRSGAVASFEALLRWRSPDLGTVQPSEFLEVAERAGLSAAIEEWVVVRVCGDKAAWAAAGLDSPPVYINVSLPQLLNPRFASVLEETAARCGLGLRDIGLEVAESPSFLEDKKAVERLERLRRQGLHLAVDHFGTGQYSFRLLTMLDFGILKLDQAFVREAPSNRDASCIVEAVVTMAHALGLQVVADGLETAEQRATAVQAGCELGQGGLLQPPLSAEEVPGFLIVG